MDNTFYRPRKNDWPGHNPLPPPSTAPATNSQSRTTPGPPISPTTFFLNDEPGSPAQDTGHDPYSVYHTGAYPHRAPASPSQTGSGNPAYPHPHPPSYSQETPTGWNQGRRSPAYLGNATSPHSFPLAENPAALHWPGPRGNPSIRRPSPLALSLVTSTPPNQGGNADTPGLRTFFLSSPTSPSPSHGASFQTDPVSSTGPSQYPQTHKRFESFDSGCTGPYPIAQIMRRSMDSSGRDVDHRYMSVYGVTKPAHGPEAYQNLTQQGTVLSTWLREDFLRHLYQSQGPWDPHWVRWDQLEGAVNSFSPQALTTPVPQVESPSDEAVWDPDRTFPAHEYRWSHGSSGHNRSSVGSHHLPPSAREYARTLRQFGTITIGDGNLSPGGENHEEADFRGAGPPESPGSSRRQYYG